MLSEKDSQKTKQNIDMKNQPSRNLHTALEANTHSRAIQDVKI